MFLHKVIHISQESHMKPARTDPCNVSDLGLCLQGNDGNPGPPGPPGPPGEKV